MRIGPLSVFAASVFCVASLVVPAAVDPPPTLYVTGNAGGNNCSDTGSGTPGAPIVFKTGVVPAYTGNPSSVTISGGTNGFVLAGVHDVTIDGFGIRNTTSTGIVVSNSGDITINHDFLVAGPGVDGPRVDGIDVTGTSSNVAVSRGDFGADGTQGSVGAG